jgi:hypothetical protein
MGHYILAKKEQLPNYISEIKNKNLLSVYMENTLNGEKVL